MKSYEFAPGGKPGGAAWFGIRPEHVVVGDMASIMPVKQDVEVEIVEPMGSDTLVWTKLAGQDFRFRMDGQEDVHEGNRLQIGFDPARASIFDKASEQRM